MLLLLLVLLLYYLRQRPVCLTRVLLSGGVEVWRVEVRRVDLTLGALGDAALLVADVGVCRVAPRTPGASGHGFAAEVLPEVSLWVQIWIVPGGREGGRESSLKLCAQKENGAWCLNA